MKELSFNTSIEQSTQTGFEPCSIPKQNLGVLKICIIHLKHEKKSLSQLPETWPCVEHKHRALQWDSCVHTPQMEIWDILIQEAESTQLASLAHDKMEILEKIVENK